MADGIGDFIIGESPIGGIDEPILPGLLKILPSYLYVEYNDDDSLQAFVQAQNQYAQAFLDWFLSLNLPVYNAPMIIGPLLDWVARGLYGVARPALSFGTNHYIGDYNTFGFNQQRFNQLRVIGPSGFEFVNDDVFRRILTWYFYTGDGTQFSIRWLKRRVSRFLFGTDGGDPPVGQTYRISITFGPTADATVQYKRFSGKRTILSSAAFNRARFNAQDFNGINSRQTQYAQPYLKNNLVTIRIVGGVATLLSGAGFNRANFNTQNYNGLKSSFAPLDPIPLAETLQAAVQSAVLPLPFQYSFEVQLT